MDLFQFIVAVLTIVGPLIAGVGYWIKKSGDARLDQVRMQMKAADEKAKLDMEQVKSESAQALAASKSIESLTGAIVAQIEDRKESTAATKENTSALKDVKVSIESWDDRQKLFFRDFSNHITAFSTEAGKAIKSLEQVVEAAITGLNGRIDGAIPQMVSQVTPLVDRISALVEEVRQVHLVDESQNSKLDTLIREIQTMTAQLLSSMSRLEGKVEQVINREVSHETAIPDGAGGNDGSAADGAGNPGDGTGFDLQPAGAIQPVGAMG